MPESSRHITRDLCVVRSPCHTGTLPSGHRRQFLRWRIQRARPGPTRRHGCVCSHTTLPRGARPFNFRSYCACTSRTMSARDSSCDDSMESVSWNLRSTCSRNPRLREPSATEQAVTFCCYAKQPGIERCCAHHTFLAASVLIVTCKCAAPRLLASVKPRR